MCGIVGHIGRKNSVDVILEGLTRLEYRGYDSAGICIKEDDEKLRTYKKVGKIGNLKSFIGGLDLKSSIGIGHTRWATHGGVTDFNAHPHSNEQVSIVHNGIIENFNELKAELKSEGHSFQSETDTEVFLQLITKFLTQEKNLEMAVRKAYKELKGHFAFVIFSQTEEKIMAIKNSAPLVCGKNTDGSELLVSSDPYALAGITHDLYFPEDDVMVTLNPHAPEEITFTELDGQKSGRYHYKKQLAEVSISDKGNFDHFMLKEIHEQPHLIRKFVDHYLKKGEGLDLLQSLSTLSPKRVHIAACGTAWHAGLYIKNLIERELNVPVIVELASEFRYKPLIVDDEDIGLFISQSGETADTLGALQAFKKFKRPIINLGNVEGSTQYRSSNYNFQLLAGVEIGVASTKAFTQMGVAGFLLTKLLDARFPREDYVQKIASECLLLADRIEEMINFSQNIKKIAEDIYHRKGFFYTGRTELLPIALEGALKLKEIAYVHAEGYAGGELKHGPIALIDDEMVNVALVGPHLTEKMISNVEEIKARKGIIVGIGPKDHHLFSKSCAHYIPIDYEGLPHLGPLLSNVVCQLLSYYIAKFKGTDIDCPRNLAKSVTVE